MKMNKYKKEKSINKLKVAILGWIGIILFSFWKLISTVSIFEKKLLEIDKLSQYTKGICNYYYFNAIGFLVLGVILGLGLAALKYKKNV